MPSNSGRMNKINEELKKVISNIISVDLKNPHLTGLITVTKVDTSPDLKIAYVYVSMIGAKSNKENLTILKKAAGFVRSSLARKVNLRTTPEIVFMFDESIEYGAKIDEILKNITKDMKKDKGE